MHMLEIICAIYPEAKPLIHHLSLKKSQCIKGCDSFISSDEKIRLTLTGVGKIQAASAAALLLDQSEDPYLLSFGSAFGFQEGLFLADKITDIDTGRSFYPDLLLKTSLKETEFITGSKVLKTNDASEKFAGKIYDMESSAVYESALRFIGPHQMMFVRFVSDHDANSVHSSDIIERCEAVYPDVKELIDEILSSVSENETEEINEETDAFCERIHASRSMKEEIRQIVRYASSMDMDHHAIMHELTEQEVTSKEEGKKVLYEFRKRICE